MLSRLLIISLLFVNLQAEAQTLISGSLKDHQQQALPGANIFIKDSYDGGSSDHEGRFQFTTYTEGSQLLVISLLGYETMELEINCIGEELQFELLIKEAFNSLKAVNISAGAMEASDEKRSVVFKPLDIVTTPGANGDIVGALNTLPGTATVGNDGRLFVRGGDASETALFFDGLKVNNAYGSSLGGVPTRTRFSPQLFTGTFFSTGGYSAEYGQALSSALVLTTVKMPLRSQSDISLMTVGGSFAHTEVWDKSAVTATLGYTDLSPYMSLVPQNLKFERAPHNFTGELLYRYQFNSKSLLRVFYSNQRGGLSLQQKLPGEESPMTLGLDNQFHYGNASWDRALNDKLKLFSGLSYSYNDDELIRNAEGIQRKEQLLHAKTKLSWYASTRLTIEGGVEHLQHQFKQAYGEQAEQMQLPLTAAYSEGQYHFHERLAVKAGLRAEHDGQDLRLMPRLSAAIQLAEEQQLSLAYGNFYQRQAEEQLMQQPKLDPALSTHYIASYQYNKDKRLFRVEAFHKQYDDLLTTNGIAAANGEGYARGFDLFYRDRQTLYATDFWITYSFIDSKRQYGSFQSMVQPGYAPRHNASLVMKRWVQKLKSQVGAAFSVNDGYAYDNPNLEGEQESKTKAYHSLNLNWSYLPRPNLIFHIAVTNVLGADNVFGYRYSQQPGQDGQFAEMAMGQAADRFFFVGVFLTLSSDKKANQLNNL